VDPGDPTSGANDLAVHHVLLPTAYLASNWPLSHAAVSANGLDIAVAGRQGLALYSRQAERWRLFGDVSQERRVHCLALGWLDSVVVACSADSPEDVGGPAALPPCLLLPACCCLPVAACPLLPARCCLPPCLPPADAPRAAVAPGGPRSQQRLPKSARRCSARAP
jgi:hypothetical protein